MCIVHSTSMTSGTIVVSDNTVKPKSIIQKIDNMRGVIETFYFKFKFRILLIKAESSD
jgi:hypothetical protein